MSEIRRATLIPSFGPAGAGGDDARKAKKKPLARSVRLAFSLPESNEGTCPVYNYKEELAAAKKKDKTKLANGNGKATNGMDPFDEDDDDVKRIAMEMEAKYGTGPPVKKKRKGRRDDYADIGMGYDESDSFIDNTDGYDEMIPQNVTTVHGGFYINCGALEFKTDEGVSSDLSSSSSSSSSEDEDDGEERANNRNRKRVLESSDSDGETETDKEKDKDKDKEKAAHVEKKQKTAIPNVANGLAPPKKKATVENNAKALPPKKSVVVDGEKKRTVKELLRDKREDESKDAKVSKLSDTRDKDKKLSVSASDPVDAVVSIEKRREVECPMEPGKDKTPPPLPSPKPMEMSSVSSQKAAPLPENLPENISDILRKIKDNVQKNKDIKEELFSGSVNSLLILFERKSKVLGKQSRSRIYQHLAQIFDHTKENLCRRAKALVMEEDTKRLKNLLSQLKTKVDAAMPPLLEAYERLKAAEVEEGKPARMPKRKFHWTDETRKMFREIIIIKKRLLIYEGKTKETIEIHLNLFIKSDVQALWPDGWMTMAALFKLSNNFDKKPPLNASAELNSSSEAAHLSSAGSTMPAPKQTKPPKKVANKDAPKTTIAGPILSAKDMQKLQHSNALSITPINPLIPPPTQELPKKPKGNNDYTIDKIESAATALPLFNTGQANAVSISPISAKQIDTPLVHKSTIQARNTYKPDPKDVPVGAASPEKTTKFVNLTQQATTISNQDAAEIRPVRAPTEHNIENIMKAANLSKPRSSSASDISKSESIKSSKSCNEILIPKLEAGTDSPTSTTRIPLENFMPKPMVEVKEESAVEDDVIVLDDTYEDTASLRIPQGIVDLKRKPAPPKSKSSNKYYDAAVIKPVKSASAIDPKSKLGTKSDVMKDNEKVMKKDTKSHEGEDILKLMENLKELNKMTTPSKSNESSPSSAVSVIAYNKTYSTKNSSSGGGGSMSSPSATKSNHEQAALKAEYPGISFQDVYHRQFLNELKNTLAAPPTATTASKTYNSAHSSSSTSQPDKHHYTNSNNNYTTAQGALKYKNNYTAQQHPGTFNLMDDMLANFITEYAYPQTANHKQKPPHK